jgi:hypothetical protein
MERMRHDLDSSGGKAVAVTDYPGMLQFIAICNM